MTDPIPARVAALKTMPMPDLKSEWRTLFETEPPPFNRRHLENRIAYRIQELAYGGLKPETIRRLEILGEQYDSDNVTTRRIRHDARPVPEFALLAEPDRQGIEAAFSLVLETLESSKLIAVIRERVSGFRTSGYPTLLGRVTGPPPARKDSGGAETLGVNDGKKASEPASAQPEYVAASALRVTFAKPYLSDEQDVGAYLDALREKLTTEIRAGRRVTV